MPADDALLFIDANKYLDLYRIEQGEKLLAPLGEQVDYIFVPQQVVNEFQRNKAKVVADSLSQKFQELKPNIFNNPDYLINAINASVEQRKDIRHQTREIKQKIKQVICEMNVFALDLVEQVSSSNDEVSKALASIFANAVHHSPEELQKARQRKELGNPPGKSAGSIGDQLNWEQILTRFKGKKRLWIITRDGDYGTFYDRKFFLNPFLYDDLRKVASDPEVYLFQDMAEGLKHFVDTTGVKAEQTLSPEELEEIKEEEKSLPPLDMVSEAMSQVWTSSLNTLNQAVIQILASSPMNVVNQAVAQTLTDIAKGDTAKSALGKLEQANKQLLQVARNDFPKLEQADREARRQAAANLAEADSIIEEAR